MSDLILHSFFRSTASIRVRVALNLKGLKYGYVSHHLRKNEHRSAGYLAVNPQGLVPALVLGDGTVVPQSPAIMEYLEEAYPEPPLLPRSAVDRAHVRAIAAAIACDVHPINNLRVLTYLKTEFGADDEATNRWARHWVDETFAPVEKMLSTDRRTGRFCLGGAPGIADICLYAQNFNNRRFGVDMTRYPTIARIVEACGALPAFADAAPERQPDAE